MVLRIGITIIIILLVVGAYLKISDILRERRLEEYDNFSGVIVETAIAAELYRNFQDSFFVARDSILKRYGLTLEQVRDFEHKYKGDEYRWAEFWDYVTLKADSLITYQESLLRKSGDTLPDSVR